MKTTISFLLVLGCLLASSMNAQAQAIPRVLAPDPAALLAELQLHEWPPMLHWDLREFPNCAVPWAMNPNPVPDLDANGVDNTPVDRAAARAAFVASFAAWQAVAPAIINFVEAGAPAAGGVGMDGFNTIGFGDGAMDDVQVVAVGGVVVAGGVVVGPGPNGMLESQPMGDDIVVGTDIVDGGNLVADSFANTYGSVVGALAFTAIFFNNQTGRIIEADVTFDPTWTWVVNPLTNDCAPPPDSFNVAGTAIHEIGHFIGIAHPILPNPAAADAADGVTPTMHAFACPAFGGNNFDQTLENADVDPCNFLYCPDLGDAPDPWMGVFNQYPTLVHLVGAGRVLNGLQLDAPAQGAEHIFGIKPVQGGRNWTYEWLARFNGPGVTPECEANVVDKDPLDDGVTWFPNPPIWGRPLTVTAWIKYASDNSGNSHNYPARGLFANAWIDLNQNCVWEEWFLSAGMVPPLPLGPNVILTTTATGVVLLPPVIDPTRPVWLRARVDYGENVGLVNNVDGTLAADKGAAQFGEVEDYPLTCRTKYEQHWLFNPLPYPVDGVAMVFAGPPEPGDQLWSPQVNGSDCIAGMDPPPIATFVPSRDEMAVEYPVPTLIPPSQPKHVGMCRPVSPPARPVTVLRSFLFKVDGTPCRATCSQEEVPLELRIPSVNVNLGSLDNDTGAIDFTVGTVDFDNGGWISLVDAENRVWSDQLQVTVGYRLSPTLLPLQSLSPCDPAYAALPLVDVGSGVVTPEDALTFVVTDNLPSPHLYVIVEVETSWGTNGTVNRQIIEFPEPLGETTPIDNTPTPKQLVLESYPNPFNPATTIRFALPTSQAVSLAVYDVSGRLVRTLLNNSRKPAGFFETEWNGTDDRGRQVASGVYFFRLTAGSETLTRKAVLLK